MTRPFMAGQFIWTGIDYRGECTWPDIFSASGSVDPVCWKKDDFYLNQAHWSTEPMVHLLPHWNGWQAGEEKEVWVYTNCEEAELFLNGESFGKKSSELGAMPHWQVPYQPGTIKAVGYIKGVAVTEDTRTTTGKAAALALVLETGLPHTGGDMTLVTCFAVDAEGREVPDAEPLVRFSAENGGIVATFGAIWDAVPVRETQRKMQSNRAMACLLPDAPGMLTLTAEAEGLEPAVLMVPVFAGKKKPELLPAANDFRVNGWYSTILPEAEMPDLTTAGVRRDENTFVTWRGEGESPFANGAGWMVYAVEVGQPWMKKLVCTAVTGKGTLVIRQGDRVLAAEPFEGRNCCVSVVSAALPGEGITVVIVLYGDSPNCGIQGKIYWTEG